MQNPGYTPPAPPVRIFLDTDMATDCDDAGAMAVLHALAARGEADIAGIVTNNSDPASIGAVAAINAFYGRPDIPLGAYQGHEVGHPAASFVRQLADDTQSYDHKVTRRDQVSAAVETYRQILSVAEPENVVIVSIGHLNNLADLMLSPPDPYSSLPGLEIIKNKRPRLVIMGGDYPSGREHNFWARGSIPSTRSVLNLWPTPILYSGYTLGEKVVTGPALSVLPEQHPVRRAYAEHGTKPLERGRPSWDQTAVLAAVRGVEPYWSLSSPGRNHVNADGSNFWVSDPRGRDAYLEESMPAEQVADEISKLMIQGALK